MLVFAQYAVIQPWLLLLGSLMLDSLYTKLMIKEKYIHMISLYFSGKCLHHHITTDAQTLEPTNVANIPRLGNCCQRLWIRELQKSRCWCCWSQVIFWVVFLLACYGCSHQQQRKSAGLCSMKIHSLLGLLSCSYPLPSFSKMQPGPVTVLYQLCLTHYSLDCMPSFLAAL